LALRCGVEAELADIFEKMQMVARNDNRETVTPGDMRLILAVEGKDYISKYVMERLKKKDCKMDKMIGYSTGDETSEDEQKKKKSDKQKKERRDKQKKTSEINDQSDEMNEE